MIYRIVISEAAEQEIRERVAWWRDHRSALQAERWLDQIYSALDSLSKWPTRCPFALETELLPTGIRQLLFGVRQKSTHRIVFTIADQTVVILRVRHVARQELTAEDLL